MELATPAEISPRHLSFIENGRSVPSREAVLRLAEALGLELRERNPLLLAAGYAPVYRETSVEAPHMSAVRDMVRQVLAAHEPHPAVVLDRTRPPW
jgi:transcriptional regulator with XRE-family HTH domain